MCAFLAGEEAFVYIKLLSFIFFIMYLYIAIYVNCLVGNNVKMEKE